MITRGCGYWATTITNQAHIKKGSAAGRCGCAANTNTPLHSGGVFAKQKAGFFLPAVQRGGIGGCCGCDRHQGATLTTN